MAIHLVRDLGNWLIAQGQGTALATDVFLDSRPAEPDHCLTLVDTGGYAPFSGINDLKRTVQLVCRDRSVVVAKAWAWALYALLSPASGRLIVQGTTIMVTVAQQPPFGIGPDDNGRALYAFNIFAITQPDQDVS
jgi:hypothetical protein